MKTLLATVFLLQSFTFSFAQSENSDEYFLAGPEWFSGSVLLNNGSEIKGLIKYNDKTDIVCLESTRVSKSFTSRHVKAFEFFDEIEQKQRIYYSVEIEDRINSIKRPLFFEILMELQNFALISKVAPISIEKREYATPAMFNPATGGFSAGRYYGYPSTISHTETLFLMSKDGEVRPFLEIKEKEIDGMFFDRSVVKNRLIDEDAFKRFTGSHYHALMTFAKDNDIELKQKQGIIAVLEHYRELSAK